MEIGSPQLYVEVNRVSRELDKTFLKELGPFLKALARITISAEINRSKDDKVTPGKDLGAVFFNMAGSFMLFRGAPMQADWVKPYADKVGTKIYLP